jgi:hypothetical protein
MRTTLTLDDDVERQLRELCERRQTPFKQAVNEALRVGLARLLERQSAERPTYRTEPVSLGAPTLPNLDNIAEILSVTEGESRR